MTARRRLAGPHRLTRRAGFCKITHSFGGDGRFLFSLSAIIHNRSMTPDTKSDITTHTSITGRELPPTLAALRELSWNYWWSWSPDGSEIFRDLDPNLWAQCEQNPRLLLTQISDLRLAQI